MALGDLSVKRIKETSIKLQKLFCPASVRRIASQLIRMKSVFGQAL